MDPRIDSDFLDPHAENIGRELVQKLNEVHGPQWAHLADLAKLVISLCSAILVGTITFSESLVGAVPGSAALWLLFASWAALLVALVCSLGSLWAQTHLLSFHPRWINSKSVLRERVAALDDLATLADDVDVIVGEVLMEALKPIQSADAWANRFLRAAFVLFVLGLAGFLVFGAVRLACAG